MTQSLQELLDRVRAAQPEPAEWAALQSRVRAAMVNASPTTDQAADQSADECADQEPEDEVFRSNAAQQTGLVRGGWGTWVGASVVVGVVVAGFVLSNQPKVIVAEGEQSAGLALELAAQSIAGGPSVVEPSSVGAGAVSVSSVGVSNSEQRGEVRSARPKVRKPAPNPHSTATPSVKADSVATPSVTSEAKPSSVAPEVRDLGESDVEYDRRHLAPIDAALHAQQPRHALQLLAAFAPRKLTNYANALRAIALCAVGEADEGKRLGEQTLPRVTNRGLARRVQNACKLTPTD